MSPSPFHLRIVNSFDFHSWRNHPAQSPGTHRGKISVAELSEVSIHHEMGIQDGHTTCQNNPPKGKKFTSNAAWLYVLLAFFGNFTDHSLFLLLIPFLFRARSPPLFPLKPAPFTEAPDSTLGVSVGWGDWGEKASCLHINIFLKQKHRR